MQTPHTAREINREIAAVDVHAHLGAFRNSSSRVWNDCMSGGAQTVLRRATLANIRLTVVSPLSGLVPRGKADPVSGNEEAARGLPAVRGRLPRSHPHSGPPGVWIRRRPDIPGAGDPEVQT